MSFLCVVGVEHDQFVIVWTSKQGFVHDCSKKLSKYVKVGIGQTFAQWDDQALGRDASFFAGGEDSRNKGHVPLCAYSIAIII